VSPPTKDPRDIYPEVRGIKYSSFQLPSEGLTPEQRRAALGELHDYLSVQRGHFLGFQANQSLEYEGDLKQYLDYHVNNIGDPFQSGNFTLNTKWMERAILDYYASLWNARWPHDPGDGDSYWGYVLSMGSTEGNLYGLWNARDYLEGKVLLYDPAVEEEARQASMDGQSRPVAPSSTYRQYTIRGGGPNARTPVVFYSQDTHYSVIKAIRVLGMKTFYDIGAEQYPYHNPLDPGRAWPQEVPSSGGDEGPGSIDIPSLAKLVEFFASLGYPILVFFNYGTTFKGAYDDVKAAGEALMPIIRRYGLYERKVDIDPSHGTRWVKRNGFWFHVDGALGAAFMPFIEMACDDRKIDQYVPKFDFRLPYVHSISMSAHKWIGAPWPCGVYMTKTKTRMRPSDDPEYLGSPDTTFAGSRNGFSAMILWDYLARNSYDAQIRKALRLEELANRVCKRLLGLERKLGQKLWVERSPLSLTIRFRRPRPEIVFKYSLSNETLFVRGEKRDYSHIFIMDHVNSRLINKFIKDLKQPGCFPAQSLGKPDTQLKGPPVKTGEGNIPVPDKGRGLK
jgi:histidine decarboxylase